MALHIGGLCGGPDPMALLGIALVGAVCSSPAPEATLPKSQGSLRHVLKSKWRQLCFHSSCTLHTSRDGICTKAYCLCSLEWWLKWFLGLLEPQGRLHQNAGSRLEAVLGRDPTGPSPETILSSRPWRSEPVMGMAACCLTYLQGHFSIVLINSSWFLSIHTNLFII